MITTEADLEAQLQRLDRKFEPLGGGTYLVSMGAGQPPCALKLAPPVLVAQAQVGSAPSLGEPGSAALLWRLLELNASGLLHAAFAIEGSAIVLTSALPLENLDLNELDAVLSDMDLALAQHVPQLRGLSRGQ